jgi:hypothetical protein
MHRLVIHHNTEKLIGHCYCDRWEVFLNRVRPIVGDNWIVLITGNPGYCVRRSLRGFKATQNVIQSDNPIEANIHKPIPTIRLLSQARRSRYPRVRAAQTALQYSLGHQQQTQPLCPTLQRHLNKRRSQSFG